jgi:hypothetical protein
LDPYQVGKPSVRADLDRGADDGAFVATLVDVRLETLERCELR